MTAITEKNRILSIDLVRGLAMIIMALDHTRDYFHKFAFFYEATDLEHTSTAIFLTRWITHFCAPSFIFLSGTSAFISGQKKSKKQLSLFLFKRGLWLVVLELTIVNFGWLFNPAFDFQNLQVIWVIGFCMMLLALLIHIPIRLLLIFAILLIAGHNLLDSVHVTGKSLDAFAWSVLHEFGYFTLGPINIYLVYPVIPWIGVMSLGYCFGQLYLPESSASARKKTILSWGLAGVFIFLAIRYINVYGDPSHWSVQKSNLFTLLSFLNASKYPPSLVFLLMTLSPMLLLLAVTETTQNYFSKKISLFGRIPLFFYVIHLYVIHSIALIAAVMQGFHFKDLVLTSGWISEQEALKGFGFSLPVVFLFWLFIIFLLYFPCRWYERYKSTHKHWWLSYL